MIAIVPGYISRSVAGSYDNEGIAIFCMLLTYYFWIKAVNTGTILWATLTALAYFYMVSVLLTFYFIIKNIIYWSNRSMSLSIIHLVMINIHFKKIKISQEASHGAE